MLDKQHLARLRQLQDCEEDARLLARLAGSFLERAAAQLGGMRALLAEGKIDTLAEDAHAVAGSSGMFGMSRVRERCLALENAVRAGVLEGAEELLAAAVREFELARPELMAEFGIS
ncbi:MAG TPA: Hpt domain-containing protein [Myxococcaceae bacterium]|nr:Hpt domain-containing protein [Myxococcaceae bacterium]